MDLTNMLQEKASKVFGTSNVEFTEAISQIVEECGGAEGLIKKFEEKGYGEIIHSWLGTDENKPIVAEQVTESLGFDLIQRVSSRVDMTPESLAQQIATYLPMIMHKL